LGFFANVKAAFTRGKKQSRRPSAITDYNGASTTRFYGQKYDGGLPFFTPTLMLDSEGIRNRVRELSHTSLQLRALIERNVDTVIGQGLNISPEPKHKLVGITPEKAKEWISDEKTRFELWEMSQKANRSSRYNFYQAQRLIQKCLRRDGEVFVALSYHNDPSLLSPLRFEIIDPSQIRESAMTWTATGASLLPRLNREGITRNADGEEVSYKVWTTDANGLPRMTEIPRVGRGGRIMMLHAVTGNDYAGQLRGVSPYAVCVQDLENILTFTLSQVNKSKHQSQINFTVESETDEPGEDPIEAAQARRVKKAFGEGKAAKEFGSDPEPDPSAQNVTEESLEPFSLEIPNTNFNRPGSVGILALKGKQKLKAVPDASPSQQFNVFVDAYFAYIAASTGDSVENVLMKFRNNYSASRATLILTWRIAVQQRWEFDYYIGGPVYEMWLACEIAAGYARCPGWSDPRLRAAWVSHRYNGVSMPNIDPEKTAKAAKEYLSVGATTLEDVAIEYNDSDAESNRVKLGPELEELRGLGKMPWVDNSGNDKNNEDEEEDEDG